GPGRTDHDQLRPVHRRRAAGGGTGAGAPLLARRPPAPSGVAGGHRHRLGGVRRGRRRVLRVDPALAALGRGQVAVPAPGLGRRRRGGRAGGRGPARLGRAGARPPLPRGRHPVRARRDRARHDHGARPDRHAVVGRFRLGRDGAPVARPPPRPDGRPGDLLVLPQAVVRLPRRGGPGLPPARRARTRPRRL
ncbi:MAG: hypothetical protein AVDCRST_MAG64-1097, partial [uncultured Phycisphaerae bacterium]